MKQNQQFEKILQRKVEVSPQVNRAMEQAYAQLREKQSGKTVEKCHKKRFRITAAIVAAAIVCTTSTMAFAAINGGVLDNMFGNSTKENLPAKETTQMKGDTPISVNLPAKTFAAVDTDQAQKLLGDKIMTTPVTVPIGDHTLTITGFVYDKNGGVMTYTLEREGGVTLLAADSETNQGKGAHFSSDSRYQFYLVTSGGFAGENTYVDWNQSTDDRWVCTSYFAWGEALEDGEPIKLEVEHSNYSANEYMELVKEITGVDPNTTSLTEEQWEQADAIPVTHQHKQYDVTNKSPVAVKNAVAPSGEQAELSPFGMRILNASGLVNDGKFDPADLENLEIRFQSGVNYLVYQQEGEWVDNSGYMVGLDEDLTILFNRLIDVGDVKEIVVNDTVYTLA